jgi:glycosyltransferase involved in cell wall biosynthesis
MTWNHQESPKAAASTPLVSVVIPVFNVERYLAECLDSALGQTLENIEVICVDDGSSDASLQILEEYKQRDARVTVVSQPNHGQSAARNRGLDLARGRYLYFLDSDDTIAVHALYELCACAQRDELDLIQFDTESSFESEELRIRHPHMGFRPRTCHYPSVWTGSEIFAAMIQNNDYRISVCIMFIRTALLREARLRFIEGAIYEDNSFVFMLMLHANRVRYIRKNYYHYRIRPNSTITSPVGVKNFRGYLTNCAAMLVFVQSRSLSPKVADAAHQRIAVMHRHAANIYRHLPQEKKELISFRPGSMEAALYAMIKEQDRWNLARAEVSDNEHQKRLTQEQARVSALTAELELLRNSNALRIGRAFTAIPRKLRNLVLRPGKHS